MGATKMRTGATMFLRREAMKQTQERDETDEATMKPDRNIQVVCRGSAKKPTNGTPGDGTNQGGRMRDLDHSLASMADAALAASAKPVAPIRLSLNDAPEPQRPKLYREFVDRSVVRFDVEPLRDVPF